MGLLQSKGFGRSLPPGTAYGTSPRPVLFEGVMDRVAGCVARTVAGRRSRASSSSALPRTSPQSVGETRILPSFLATTGNIDPRFRLVGQAMGIIDASVKSEPRVRRVFRGRSGVAGALIATAAGLFTAIPAVIAYNYFLKRIRRTAFRLDTVTIS